MSNKSNRGHKELQCLQDVKKIIPTNHPIRLYLESATPNKHLSEFPDFIFSQGFIEHFQVTSAKESSKGDQNRISEVSFEKNCQEEFDRDKQAFLSSKPCPHTMSTKVVEMEPPEYSYQFFINSFKRNFEHHIHSLSKFSGEKSVGIFLIEHAGARITVLHNGKYTRFYKIQCDRNLLSYLSAFVDKLKYLILFWGETVGDLNGSISCEIIEMSRLPEMIQNAPQNTSFGVGHVINQKLTIFLDW